MANEEHLKILRQGVEAWNRRRENLKVEPALLSVDLRRAEMRAPAWRVQRDIEALSADFVIVGRVLEGGSFPRGILNTEIAALQTRSRMPRMPSRWRLCQVADDVCYHHNPDHDEQHRACVDVSAILRFENGDSQN